ncbi:glycosyltransferase [Tautonia sociabilis]|uniref:Glycosyltransferase n=1 Tax=Tautonia sociabilis TaxID=2080755 RepID=A0A432MEH7_9BACT|nr:glycosyltransferase [Tautonia sociabilis]RUL83888.1 glycosyltransferase [Tautonia sociabilis]
MLKVLQVIPTLDRSGAEKQMVMLALGLPRDRFRVEVAALTRLGPLEEQLRAGGVPVHAIGKRHKVDPGALGRLTRLLRDRRFDVVQTWIFAANVYGRIASRRAGVPVVVTAEMAVDLWKGKGHVLIDRRLARWTDRVVGNSQAVVDFYRDAVGIDPEKLERIFSGIGDEEPPEVDRRAVREELGLPPEATLLLFAGRLYPQKGVIDLLKAADLLQHVRPNLRTVIAGDGPLRGELEAFARAVELLETGRVLFLGHREDVPRLLAAADALVLPSSFEGLPNVVLEAMRFRKPVVATAAPGTTEVVVDGQTGLLVPVGDATALARALLRVVDDPELARRLGEQGRARVESEFRAGVMIDRFAALYERIAREKGIAGV